MADILTLFFLIALIVLEIHAEPTSVKEEELPLTRSLGYSVHERFGADVSNSRVSQEYMELYQDAVRASQESFERFDDKEEERLENIVGRERLQVMKRGILERRRKASRMLSAVGRRRSRSQATRREKLNSQSLRSHHDHIRMSGQKHDH